MPNSPLSALNVILGQARLLDMSYINIGHTYFRTDGKVLDLGFGKEVWYGMFSSVRPNSWTEGGTQSLATLNVNIVMKVRIIIEGGF